MQALTVYHISNLLCTHPSSGACKAVDYGFFDLHSPKIRIFARLAEISRYESRSIPLHCQMKNVSVVQRIGRSPTKPEIEVRVLTEIQMEQWQMWSLRRTENPRELDRNQPVPQIEIFFTLDWELSIGIGVILSVNLVRIHLLPLSYIV